MRTCPTHSSSVTTEACLDSWAAADDTEAVHATGAAAGAVAVAVAVAAAADVDVDADVPADAPDSSLGATQMPASTSDPTPSTDASTGRKLENDTWNSKTCGMACHT